MEFWYITKKYFCKILGHELSTARSCQMAKTLRSVISPCIFGTSYHTTTILARKSCAPHSRWVLSTPHPGAASLVLPLSMPHYYSWVLSQKERRFSYFLQAFYYYFVCFYKDDSYHIVEHENYCAKIQQTVFMHFVSTFVRC